MSFKQSGEIKIRPSDISQKVRYWVNEDTKTVVYVWSKSGKTRIIEWNYSDKLTNEKGIVNKLRTSLGGSKNLSTTANQEHGEIIEEYTITDYTNPFEHAVEQARKKYNLPN